MVNFGNCIKRCKKSGKIVGFNLNKNLAIWMIPIVGLLSFIWFVIRVLPKPSRISYPCQKVAAPFAAAFVSWILGFGAMIVTLRKAKTDFKNARFVSGAVCVAVAIAAFMFFTPDSKLQATTMASSTMVRNALSLIGINFTYPYTVVEFNQTANQPIGSAKGIKAGRVVWTHDTSATNENCTNNNENFYWQHQNTDVEKVSAMFEKSLLEITGASTSELAWDTLFRYFNISKGKGNKGYSAGEKIAIKVNLTSGSSCVSAVNGDRGYERLVVENGVGYETRNYTETSPQMMLAVIWSLVNKGGVRQQDIVIGDPLRRFFNDFFNLVYPEFPDVVYIDTWGMNGRVLAEPVDGAMVYSNRVSWQYDPIPKQFVDATYLINCAALKAHKLAGITMCAKNHYGSAMRYWWKKYYDPVSGDSIDFKHYRAENRHQFLPTGENSLGRNKYRDLVDFMGHKDLDGKSMLFVLDALWCGKEALPVPNKWKTAPFNNDWPSSILVSQDEVALESVGYDLLRTEYHPDNYSDETYQYPNRIEGVDDYLHQAASSTEWPATIQYDPENDGTVLQSLGVHEHWNNATEKKYSKNLNPNAAGIELVYVNLNQVATKPAAPLNLLATVISSSQIDLSWSDKSNNETGFKIYQSTTTTKPATAMHTTTSNVQTYSATGLNANTTYYFWVEAINGIGTSSAITANAKTEENGSGTTTKIEAENATFVGGKIMSHSSASGSKYYDPSNGSKLTFSYSAPSAGAYTLSFSLISYSGTRSWGVYVNTIKAGVVSSSSPYYTWETKSLTSVNLASGTNTIELRDSEGTSEADVDFMEVSGGTSGTIPTAPTGLVATAISSSQINLSWADNSNNETGFKIYQSTTNSKPTNATTTTTASVNSYSAKELSANTTYYFWVEATNGTGTSSAITANAKTEENGNGTTTKIEAENATFLGGKVMSHSSASGSKYYDPSNGSKLTFSYSAPGAGSYTLSFSLISYSGTRSWGVYVNDIKAGVVSSSSPYYTWETKSLTSVNLVNGTNTIELRDSEGTSEADVDFIEVSGGTSGTIPTAPTGLVATAISSSQINLSWVDNSNNETGFKVYKSTTNSKPTNATTTTAAGVNTYSATELFANTTYYFWVEATNGTGTSSAITANAKTDALAGSTIKIEAENGTFVGGAVKNHSSASGGKYYDPSSGSKLTFSYSAPSAGPYTLSFRLISYSGTRSWGVYVNNIKAGVVSSSSPYYTWETKSLSSVSLASGTNTIELRDSEGTAEADVDYLEISN